MGNMADCFECSDAARTAKPTLTPKPNEPECVLRIIAVNDIHELGNMAHLKACIDAHRTDNSIVTCAGGFFAPSLLSSIDKGRGMLELMNRVGVQFVCPGNHEAKIPFKELQQRMKDSKFTWLHSNMPDLNREGLRALQHYAIVEVQGEHTTRKVGLLGLATNATTLLPRMAFGGATILDPLETAAMYAKMLEDQVDCIVPLTCLDMDEDVALANMGLGLPVALGGHDGNVKHEIIEGQHLLKLGTDANHIGIVDLTWTGKSKKSPRVNVKIHDSQTYQPDPKLLEYIKGYEQVVAGLFTVQLSPFPAGPKMSSCCVRDSATTMGTFLCTAAREAFGAHCCINRSGDIRGSYEYAKQKYFTFSDLVRETPVDLAMVVVTVPGRVIAETIKFSRTKPHIGTGDFLQIDNGMIYDKQKEVLTHIDNAPLDPDKGYDMVVPYRVLSGTLVPFVDWVHANRNQVPPSPHCGMTIQVALVAYWSAAVWLHLAHIREVADSDGVVNQTHLKRHLRKLHPNSPAAHIISQNVIAQYEKKGWLLVEAFLDCARESATWRVADAHDEGPVMRDEFGAFMTDLTGADIADADLDTLFAALDSGGRGTVDRGAVRRRLSALRASNIGVPNKRGRHEWQLLRESWTRADTVAQGLTA